MTYFATHPSDEPEPFNWDARRDEFSLPFPEGYREDAELSGNSNQSNPNTK